MEWELAVCPLGSVFVGKWSGKGRGLFEGWENDGGGLCREGRCFSSNMRLSGWRKDGNFSAGRMASLSCAGEGRKVWGLTRATAGLGMHLRG